MEKVKISTSAAELVREWAKRAEEEIGTGYVPVIMWQVDDSGIEGFVPQLAVGFVEQSKADKTRVLICGGKTCEIYQYLPDDILERTGSNRIDEKNGQLVLVKERNSKTRTYP